MSAKLIRRDPRMVERKKTGLAKARKRVRLSFPNPTNLFSLPTLHSTPGSSANLIQIFLRFVGNTIPYTRFTLHLLGAYNL